MNRTVFHNNVDDGGIGFDLRSVRSRRRVERLVALVISEMQESPTTVLPSQPRGTSPTAHSMWAAGCTWSTQHSNFAAKARPPSPTAISMLSNSPVKPPHPAIQREATNLIGRLHELQPPDSCAAIRPRSNSGILGRKKPEKRAAHDISSPVLLLPGIASMLTSH